MLFCRFNLTQNALDAAIKPAYDKVKVVKSLISNLTMNKTAKWIVGVVVVALVIWVLVAANKKSQQPASNTGNDKMMAGETYKIGLLGPFTGDAAVYGEPLKKMVGIAVEEINNSGGVNGKKLELIVEDAKCNGKDASNGMQKLVNVDKVQVVLGGFCSSESLAAEPIATANKVALFSAGSSSPKLTGISPFFFRNYPSDASQGKVLADIAYNKKDWKNVAFIQEQLDYPLGIYNAFSPEFTKFGGKVTKEEFPTDTKDFRSIITKIKASNPDVVFVDTQTPAAAERIFKQMQEQKWKPNILVSDATSGDPKTVEANKAFLEGALAAEFGVDASNPKFQHIIQAYKGKYGEEPPYQSYAQTEYDAVYMLKDAIAQNSYDGTKIADWSRTVKNWDGASGKVTIGADGDRVGGHTPKVIKDGKVELYTE